MRKLVQGIVFVAVAVSAHAQCMDSLWRQTPGTAGGDWILTLLTADDGNVIAAGYVEYSTSPWFARGHIRKIDPLTGQELWAHSYVNLGSQDAFLDVARTADGGYICAGNSRTPVTLTQNFWLMKVASNGDSLWSRTYANGYGLQGRCVAPALDGGFGFAGRAVQVPNGFGSSDWLLIKTNATGDSLWSVLIGDSLEDTVTDILTNAAGDFVLMGYSLTDSSREGRMTAVSQTGQVLWDRHYYLAPQTEIYAGFELPNGGYWVCGERTPQGGNNAVYLLELDENGVERWHWVYDLLPEGNDIAFSITPDGHGGAYLFGNGYRNSTQEPDAFVAHVSPCGGLISVKWVGDTYAENVRGGALAANGRVVVSGSVTFENNQQEMLFYGLSADTCNAAPCEFYRVAPQDSTQPDWNWPLALTWTPSFDPDGDDIEYIFQLEHTYFPEAVWPTDTVVTDTFVHVEINVPVLSLDELYEFRWRVWATDGQDTTEARNGEGFFTIEIVDADEMILAPASFELAAHPNPFNPTTTLTYTIGKPGHASLALYDVQGRHVRTLLDDFTPAGTHTLQFDGSALASGVYFAQLRSGHATQLAKLVLIK